MSAAIKRLSTIIRPSSNPSSPPSPPKEAKDSIDAPAPAAPVDGATAETTPTTEVKANGTTTDADAVDAASPEQGVGATPASNEGLKDAPPAADVTKEKDATADFKPEKEGKVTHRRDPRDIGRSTIRRFSTILRSQAKDAHKDKEPTPPLPSQDESAKPAEGETKDPEEQAGVAPEAPKEAVAKENGKEDSTPAEKGAKPAKPASSTTKEKTEAGKISKRSSSSFFTAAREGLQRTAKDVQTRARGQPGAAKAKAVVKVETVAKIVKKGAAKGKRVVVITGASKGVGLEFVKQFASQPNTFVIALSRTADKSPSLKPIVSASAKEGHNVRTLKLDVASSRSIHNVVKDIVELTEGRIDLLINAAGSRGDPALKVWDLRGGELEEELRNNLIGPIAFTNALIPYLKPMPPKEEKKEEKTDTKEENKEKNVEAKGDTKETKEQEVEEQKEEKPEVKEGEKVEGKEEKNAETVETGAEKSEDVKEAKLAAPDPAVVASTVEPSAETPEAGQETATGAPEAQLGKPAEAAPVEGESPEPSPEEVPSVLPAQPFVIFLAPSDPIQNVEGAVPTGSAFAPSPRTLFSLSRAALQVAIAKYSVGLGGKGIGIVGLERHGLHDPHSGVSDEQAAAGVVKLLPELSVRDNGKLLKTSA